MRAKAKSKSSVVQKTILEKARLYVKPIALEDDSESEDEQQELKRKASKADKERKKEKRRLKKQKKREARDRSKKKDETEAKNHAINYLHMWHHARDSWNFKKKMQYWLLSNALDSDSVSEENFKILLDYIIGLKGEARNRLTAECEKVIEMHEEKFSDGSISAEDLTQFERARNILQILV